MYVTSSIENSWSDFAQMFSKMFVIARKRFLRKKILGKSTGKVGNLDVKIQQWRNNVLYIGCYWLIEHVC